MSFIIIILGLLADYFSKRWALATLSTGGRIDLIKGYLDFEYLENRGAAFGIFQGNVIALSVISLTIAAVLVYMLFKYGKQSKVLAAALSLIIAGALGNIYDRLVYGFVVDFIHAHWMDVYHFPTFNVADMCVTGGTVLMIIYILFIDGKKNEAKA